MIEIHTNHLPALDHASVHCGYLTDLSTVKILSTHLTCLLAMNAQFHASEYEQFALYECYGLVETAI